jgi:isoleucyl-tRNA synthetase
MDNNNTKSESALREERILEFWRENKTFEKSLEKKAPKGHYVFYDGPPFATGQIHYGHILGSTAKDVIGRYQTMRGFYVPRKWGWDCHGLPIENIVEKELKIAGHQEIEEYGIDKFVEYARSKVLQYDKDWEKGIERIGRWVDFRGSYKTMDNTFIESVWWALSELNKKDLIYEGVRVLAYCPRCETPIANSEIAMDNSYKDISDISVYVKFELEDLEGKSTSYGAGDPRTYLLAWTTTPWTLPGNTAIAINKNFTYVKVKMGDEVFILAKETLQNVFKDKEYTVLGEIMGSDLIGKKYQPVFPYYKNSEAAKNKNIWKVWHADFVTLDKGTGMAHEAPAFGEDDMNLAKQNDIPWIIHVDETGRFKPEVTDFAGMQVKPQSEEKDGHQKADIEVLKYLANNKVLFAKEKIIHSYPHCYRCETPIIYYALPSWFINIKKVKKNVVGRAEDMNWIPSHLKEGRFKNIMENAPDWNISRNRYWASPLPIWKCEKCKKQTFVNSLQDLKDKTKKSGNKYFVMRHGVSIANAKNAESLKAGEENDALTKEGIEQIKTKAKSLEIKPDIIISSGFIRTKQTAEIIAEVFNIQKEQIIINEELREAGAEESPDENSEDIRKRMIGILSDLEKKYSEKNILIISHEYPIRVLLSGYESLSEKEEFDNLNIKYPSIQNAKVFQCDFSLLPRNSTGQIDLHRPYIDEVPLVCGCGGDLIRIPEVLDCWFESGSMPFAQDHYPFENKNWQKNNFPAGFVAEYIAQTRTWFYYTHVVSTILFDHAPFKNVVTTGTLRAEDGEKMSKSKNNYPDPWSFIDKYGADALRIYLMSSTLMKGEDANFSEKAVQDIASKIIGRLFNVLAFYELYREKALEADDEPKSKDVLDVWILSRLHQTLEEITKGMEGYDMAEATRPVDLFIDDLSTWYLRRSRDRIKDGDKEAKITLYYILKTLAKVLAPFAPFTAEDIWLKLRSEKDVESVHLTEWPEVGEIDTNVVVKMKLAREIVERVLFARQLQKINVRQALSELKLGQNYLLPDEYLEVIKQEVNIKKITKSDDLKLDQTQWFEIRRLLDNPAEDMLLNIFITPELKQEGDYRELARALQDMRKKMGLTPSDVVVITFETDEAGKKLIQKFENDMKKTVLVSEVEFKNTDGEKVKIDNLIFKIKIEK